MVSSLWRPVSALAAVAMLVASSRAQAGGKDFELFGNAEVITLGKKNYATFVVSDATATDPYGGITITPKQKVTFARLHSLQAKFQLIEGGAGGGSPRFAIGIDGDGDGDADGNVFVYLGTPPGFDDDVEFFETMDTGELIGSTDLRFDTTQVGGTFYDDYAGALALVGNMKVVYVDFVVDSYWFFPPDNIQSVLVYELRVDKAVYRPRP